MNQVKTRSWMAVPVALLPLLAGVLTVGCDDDDPDPVVDSGAGGTGGGSAGAGGTGTGGTPGAGGAGGGDAAPSEGGDGVACADPVQVDSDITASTTWNCPKYLLNKKIYVTSASPATPTVLTIAEGVQILGNAMAPASDKPALIVARGSKLMAIGTKDKPIVFTSSTAPGMRKGGDWAGLALLGSAKINTGGTGANCATTACEAGIEGIPETELKAKFGGADDASSCGELKYVRIEFAGAELMPTRELNGLTLGGCGEGTKISYVQVHRGTDDGIEFFGGKAGMDHVVLSANEDDSLDWDYGWSGKVQFLVIHQRSGSGDNGIEASGSPMVATATPRSAPVLYNVTMLGRADGASGSSSRPSSALWLKEGTHGTLRNFIIQGFKLDVVDFDTSKDPTLDPNAEWPALLSIENSLFWMNGPYGVETAGVAPADDDKGFDEKTKVEEAARNNKIDVDPMLTMVPPLTGAEIPNYVPKNAAVGPQATPPAPLDATATYAGAVAPNATTSWTDGWTAFPLN
jgi:hypothetical protein